MPKKITQDEKNLRLFYENYLGYSITTSNWCNVKKKLTSAGLSITEHNLKMYRMTHGRTIRKPVVARFDTEKNVMLDVQNFYSKQIVTGKELHDFCKEICTKHTDGQKFSYVQIKRMFAKAYLKRNELVKTPELKIRFSYKKKYDAATISQFLAFFCYWVRQHLKTNMPYPLLLSR